MNDFEFKSAIKQWERNRERTIGKLIVTLPTCPIRRGFIAGDELPKKQQKFQYTVQPKKNEEPTELFLLQEAKRFRDGYWFFNNGNIEWLTPFYYFLLNYWTDKGKQMLFVDAQRDVAYWIWGYEKDRNIAAGNLLTCRRFGKTLFGTGWLYFRTSTKSDRHGSLQSKTNPDARKVFNKLISSWSRLGDWLKPLDSGETRPASVLEFFEPRKKSSKGEKKVYQEALNSWIDFYPSTEEALDGEEVHSYYEDEVGKTVEINTDARWGVVMLCLMKGMSIIGKGLRTTTVEEMEKKGGKHFYATWVKSEQINLKTNRSQSLCTNLFVPADYGYLSIDEETGKAEYAPFMDEYGYSLREKAKQYILDTWEGKEGEDLLSAQRKTPLTLRHAFQGKDGDGEFSSPELAQQEEYLMEEAPKNLLRRVTFYLDEMDGQVKWRDDKKGYFEICWDFLNPISESNRRKLHANGLFAPALTDEFAIGVDPFAATITTGKQASMAVAYVYRKGVINDPDNSAMMVCRYAQRTRMKSDFHKNVMLMCRYYGCKANYESDVDDYYETFLQNGFKNYVMWRPSITVDPQRKRVAVKYGTPSKDPYALQKHTQVIHEYLKNHWHKLYYLELVQQLKVYTTDDRTAYDDVIAFGMALIGGFENVRNNTAPEKPRQFMKIKNGRAKRTWTV